MIAGRKNRVVVRRHPGSTNEEVAREPDWGAGHENRIGVQNAQERVPGVTHSGDDGADDEFVNEALKKHRELEQRKQLHELVNFRDVLNAQPDFHLRRPDVHSKGWRYVLHTTEDWVKYQQEWPANAKRQKQRQQDEEKNNVPATEDSETEESLEDKYTPQQIALMRSMENEKTYIANLKQNDGKGVSPVAYAPALVSIDEQDQFTPDNWVPRSTNLVRLTGKHPLNAEPNLTKLFDAGTITPNELHYVRNHGAVPHLLWETHKLSVCGLKGQPVEFGMDELTKFPTINIAVALACDGNRRKELNMIKRSKGFNWGSGGVSCAYWKGPLMRDVLLAAGVPERLDDGHRYWVNFEGADHLSDGKYATCIPFQHVMDPTNDVIIAYEMNNVPLPPDHGHPIRVIIPGYVGGRCVKWLSKIWISDRENDSHYHIWDNRVVPTLIDNQNDEFAKAAFSHPSTACNEQNLQSIIVRPAQGETFALDQVKKGHTYRIQGLAYDGGGHEVQRVEISLDGGNTWLYCVREFPDAPIRHGKKFWTWLHWHVDVELAQLIRCDSVIVRCFNVFKNTQPATPTWNVMGMMNNAWYIVKPEIIEGNGPDEVAKVFFRHPVEPAMGNGGWMEPSESVKIELAKQSVAAKDKQFTREEIEKHNSEDDCWIVVDGKVYDATSVLEWHPGGKAAIMNHAGKVWQTTSDEFASIHDEYAYNKLQECNLGVVTRKVAKFIEEQGKSGRKDETASNVALQKHRWTPVKLISRTDVSKDTRLYTFALPQDTPKLGMGNCQHVQVGFHFEDKMVIRTYSPVRPVMPSEEDGTFDIIAKTYFPDKTQPGGAMTNILDSMPIGEEVEIRGPTGDIVYLGNGKFQIEGREMFFSKVTLILGGSGFTPGYSLIARVLKSKGDNTQIRVIDGNKTENDILLRKELDEFHSQHPDQFRVTHVLSEPDDNWKGLKGFVTADIIREHGFPPDEGKTSVAFLCGPPAMIQKAALPALRDWGYQEDTDCFGF